MIDSELDSAAHAEVRDEARIMRIAPVSGEMVLCYVAEHVLGLPRSY